MAVIDIVGGASCKRDLDLAWFVETPGKVCLRFGIVGVFGVNFGAPSLFADD